MLAERDTPVQGPHCRSGDFFSPPYLFKSNGQPISDGERPAINTGQTPAYIAYGEGMSFGASAGQQANTINRISLIRPGAVTHSRNMEQRSIPFLRANGDFTFSGTVTLAANKMPSTRLAPPGYYMLFMVNDQGRPSIAPLVNLWGIVESSVEVAPGQSCGTPGVSFQVRWNTTIPTDGNDHIEIYPPGGQPGECSTTPITANPQAPSGTYHQHTLTSSTCTTGTWKVLVRSNKTWGSPPSTSVSQVSCKEFQVTCISCPPPCHPPCEIE